MNYSQNYGPRFTVTLTPDGNVTTAPGELSSVWLFNSTGLSRPEPGSFETQYSFSVSVTITDQASGAAGTLDFGGWYTSHWTYQPEDRDDPDEWRWDYEVSNFGDYWGGRGMVLGNNHYTVRAYGGASGSFPFGEMLVEIHPTGATPEPGTLALAGLGLGGLGLVNRLRRKRGVKGAIVSLAILGGLFGGAETATAGPIGWGYQVHNEGGLLVKEQFGITTDNPDDWFVSEWSVPAPEWPVLPDDAPEGFYSLKNESRAKVTIIDQTSGESGSVWIWWGKSTGWTVGPDGNRRPEWEQQYGGPIWFESDPLILGGSEYLVTSEGGPFVVKVTAGATAATPEPGSLALAGIGLAGVFARRLRKKRGAQDDRVAHC